MIEFISEYPIFFLLMEALAALFIFRFGMIVGRDNFKKEHDCTRSNHIFGPWEYYLQPMGRMGHTEKRRRMCKICKELQNEFVRH
jgi:hypothetical protein